MRLPWTQLSASPHTVHVQWKPILDHVDHAAPGAPGQWTTARPRKGTTGRRGRRGSGCPRVEEYEGLRRIAAGHGRQEHEARPALVWTAGARRPEVEEALRPLDGHRSVTGARIVHID